MAGITISQLSGSGIFERTKEARGKWQNAQNEEEMQIDKYSKEIENYVGSGRELISKITLYDGSGILLWIMRHIKVTVLIRIQLDYMHIREVKFVYII